MPDLYNLSAVQNSRGLVDLVIAANNAYPATAGQPPQLLVGGMLIAIFVVFMFLLRKNDFLDGFMVSSFVCFILAIFLRSAIGIQFVFVLGFGLLMAFSAALKIAIRR